MRIGFVGLGALGSAIVERLLVDAPTGDKYRLEA